MAKEYTEYLTDVKYYQCQELSLFMKLKVVTLVDFPKL